jgi:hypothetical protein
LYQIIIQAASNYGLQRTPQYPAALLHHAFEKRRWLTGFQDAAIIKSLFFISSTRTTNSCFIKYFHTMKKFIALLISTLFFTHFSHAQGGWSALVGSGKMVNLSPETGAFDKIDIRFNAKTIVDIGKPNSVSIEADDNLAQYLDVKMDVSQNKLIIKSNLPKNAWVQSNNIVIRISMPEISVFTQKSNGNTTINGINGRYLRTENYGNGDIILRGSKIDNLDIVTNGNGDVDAENLTATTAKIEATGNGTTSFKAVETYTATLKGNGKITNVGNGKATETTLNGNGSIGDTYSVKTKKNAWKNEPYEGNKVQKSQKEAVQKVKISLKNNSILPRKFTVITYQPSDNGSNGTTGFMLLPTASKDFEVEIGTRFYIADGGQIDTVMGGGKLSSTPFLTVKADDAGKVFSLNK